MFTLQLAIALLSQSAFIAAAPYRRAIHARDNLDDIVNALAPVSQSLAQVDAAVLALDGGPVTANNLLVSSQQAQAATDQATLNIQASGELGAIRAARLRRTTDALIDQTTTTVNDLVSRKPVLDNLGVSPVALESLQRQKISTMALSAALEQKVPRVGQRIAAEGRSQLESVLDQGIAAYSQPAVAAVPIAAPPAAAAPAAAPPAAAPPASPPAAAPPAAAVPAPAAPAPAPPAAAVPADANAGTWPDQAGAAPQAGAPAAGAATPAAPAVPVAVVPSTVNGIAPPPPQVTRPAGRRLRGKKNGNNREVEAVEADEE